ncbi:MAG: Lon protease [Glaciecola sp. HTCC2999]|nr:MAG: Lon protease [Glaciecola sp. HTCC2999]
MSQSLFSDHSFMLDLMARTRLESTQCCADLSAFDIKQLLCDTQTQRHDEHVFIGQKRAKRALEFGLGIDSPGYHLFVMGEHASGRTTLVKTYIDHYGKSTSVPSDWVYVNNISDERAPVAIEFPAGASRTFEKDMQDLVDNLLDTFPAAFDNPGYQRKALALKKEYDALYDGALETVERRARRYNIALFEDDGKVAFLPIVDNKPVEDEQFHALPETVQAEFLLHIKECEQALEEGLFELPAWKRSQSEKLRQLKRDTAEQSIKPLLKALEHTYANNIAVLKYLKSIKDHIIDSILWLDDLDDKEEKYDVAEAKAMFQSHYSPNILVQHDVDSRAPVIYEPHPTYQNVFGRIEYSTAQGSIMTDYSMIFSGALHQANGGYLLLDADKMMDQLHVWESLKRALKQQQLRVDLPQQDAGMVNSMTLLPAPIPLNVKVILLGSRELFYMLQDYDPEFEQLFGVLVDFDYELPLERNNVQDFIVCVLQHLKSVGFNDIEPDAMQFLLEYSLRLSEHQNKLSAKFSAVIDMVNQAVFFAKQTHSTVLCAAHLNTAKMEHYHRVSRVASTLLEDIKEEQILIQTQGTATGKVNGLTVLDAGGTAFGMPSRITATVYVGASGVIDIEREVELGQSIHSKGVMLLTGYLGQKYAQHFPLTLSANIALEQSYGYIDGDSASLGELIALISALTDIPCLQSLAITGSINQYGEVQSVGGINEKIEGFFDLCLHHGLNAEQGVIIPFSNQHHLMLRDDIVKAVEQGQFSIFAVKTVDEALSLLMQREAGKYNLKGRYPKGTINYTALNQLYNISNIINGGDEA